MRTVLNTIAIALLSFIFVLGCKKDETSPSNEKGITSFVFKAKNNGFIADVEGNVSGTEITVTVPYGKDLSLLVPSIEVSEQASVSPESGKPQNFTSSVSYTVTAGDSSRQDYTVNVTSAPSFSVSSYYEGENRIGAGDFKKPDLFEISDIVVDGLYTYSLKIAGKDAKDGTITIEEGKAIIYVNLPNAFWNSINDEDIPIELTISGDVFSYSTTKEQYNIRSWQDLQGMQYDLEGDYILMNDISLPQHSAEGDFPEVLPEEGFKPVGSGNNKFEGSFKGNGYVLKNFFINREDENYIGLFGYANDVTIENVGIEVASMKGKNYVGGLVGYSNSSAITKSYVTGGSIEGSGYSDVYVGGLVGYSSSGIIKNSYATGSVSQSGTGTNIYVGGLVGYIGNNGTIENSYATGSVSLNGNGTNSYVGGLIGYVSNTGNIKYSYWDKSSTGRGSSAGGNQVVGVSSRRNLIQRGINDYIDIVYNNRVFIEWEFGEGTDPNIWKFSDRSWPVLHQAD